MDATGLKVYGEGEWKVKKHSTDEKRRVWRKLHLACRHQHSRDSSGRIEFI
ncbi:transposase [Vibrio fluvialis]|uniref:transposase n=1 Tax=Vibrio fluvialis TaxID=676 RepID=UPI0036F39049